MDIYEAVAARHSVRRYSDRPVDGETRQKLDAFVAECNAQSGLRIQTVYDDMAVFDCFLARYGKFSGVENYIALVGGGENLGERCGYFGESIVLYAQTLGLNTCWAALTFRKRAVRAELGKGEKLCAVIAFGYGLTAGAARRSRTREEVMRVGGEPPEWFLRGVDAALLAPTAVNQQKFLLELCGANGVRLTRGKGFYTDIDEGIVRYHFEVGAGKENFVWKK